MKLKSTILFFIIAVNSFYAQLQSYDYYRELKPVAENAYYKLTVGSSILDRPGQYRIYELSKKDTLEVPYILEAYDNSSYDKHYFKYLNIIDKSYNEAKNSYATLVIDTPLVYTTIYLNYASPEFFKTVSVEGSQDNKTWQTIIEDEKLFHYYKSPFDHYYCNKVTFAPVSFKYIRVVTDDSNSPKIELSSAYIPLAETIESGDGEIVENEIVRTEDKEKKQTIIECTFKRNYFISCLQLDVEGDEHFHRSVDVEFLTQNTSSDKWVIFGHSNISSTSSNKIYLSNYSNGDDNFRTNKMRVIIHNLDDRPLGKITIKAFTHQEVIKFKLEKEKVYRLAYGKKNDSEPKYDLAYFKNVIPLNLAEVGMGNEMKIDHVVIPFTVPLVSNKIWIWIALLAGVLVIGLFTLKLLKQEEES